MSGGFFRGTSADQDTRFSNKQAKLLKSQKFPPELDHLVDMTKVQIDVIKPWIATRATELLGFEDEVLINFVYGLLDRKEVDGKQIQIQLTGFMEKNTGKFMKELWSLLLSAQNNVSGVPQQFLDAKEEETRKKKAETDRIAQEIQKRRDGRELERERKSRFDGEADSSRFTEAASDSVSKHPKARASSVQPEEDREVDVRHGSKSKNGRSRSPPPNDRSPSPSRTMPSPTRSNNKSISRSRSYSEEGHKSRSVSVSSLSQRHSVSPGRQSLSPKRRYRSPRRSISPPRRHSPRDARSPLRQRSPHLRRRSASRSRHRSPPPFRRLRRSPPFLRRRSPSPLRRRSPSPLRRRSPSPPRRRSPSPLHRKSPIKARWRSPSPLRRKSPVRHMPVSPVRRRYPSPLRRRSPPPKSPKHQRRSPLHSSKSHPADSHISPRERKRSCSPHRIRSPSHRTRRSLSRERDSRINGNKTSLYRDEHTSQRAHERRSPVNHILERELAERPHPSSGRKISESVSRKVPISLRSPQRDIGSQGENHNKVPVVSPENSPTQSMSPSDMQKVNSRINRRSRSLSKSPVRQRNVRMPRHDIPGTSREEEQMSHAREASRHRTDSSRKRSKYSPVSVGLRKSNVNDLSPESYSPDRRAFNQSPSAHSRPVLSELKKDSGQRSDGGLPERHVEQLSHSSEKMEYGPGRIKGERGPPSKLLKRDTFSLDKREDNEQAINDKRRPRPKNDEYRESYNETEYITRSKKKNDKKDLLEARDSDSEGTDSCQNQNMEKRRHKKSDKRKRYSDESFESDSQIDDRKEAKRRRKDEKRMRKEKRRRREKRHQRRLERRTSKLKVKSLDTVTPPSDFGKNHGGADDSDADATIKNSHPSDADETESEQKKLEIELREKALESLRAKKAISH